jgi:hypothetical protein
MPAEASLMEKIARVIAWGGLALVVLLTVSPVAWRPDFGHANIERFTAFVFAGFLFGIAYPRHFLMVSALVLGAAAVLEAVQLLIPGRDGTLPNLAIKLAGGALGLGAAYLLNTLVLPHLRGPQ